MDYANIAILIIVVIAVGIVGRYGWRRGGADNDRVIDHAPVAHAENDAWRREKLAEAARKYGKPFRCAGDLPHEQTHRQEPRSRDLQEIDAAGKREREAAKLAGTIENITRIERKAR